MIRGGLWYPDEDVRPRAIVKKKITVCPVCNGTGKRIDANTHKERDCVACKKGRV